jgi:hypothetical protein
MIRLSPVLLLSLCLPPLLCACGEGGSYELHWTIGCSDPTQPSCEVRSAKDCSSVGLDSLEVVASRQAETTRSLFSCCSFLNGPVGRGPELEPGPYVLTIYGLSPGGQALVGPITVDVSVAETGTQRVEVDLPRPPACGDGVDNDGDGLVDLQDSECKGSLDPAE